MVALLLVAIIVICLGEGWRRKTFGAMCRTSLHRAAIVGALAGLAAFALSEGMMFSEVALLVTINLIVWTVLAFLFALASYGAARLAAAGWPRLESS